MSCLGHSLEAEAKRHIYAEEAAKEIRKHFENVKLGKTTVVKLRIPERAAGGKES